MYTKSWTFLLGLLLSTGFLSAECKGRIDIGPAFARVDMLTSGKTTRTLELWGVKADATLLIYEGLCIKPSFLGVDGPANLNSGSIGIGYCIPLCDTLTITPCYGVTETRFKSRIDLPQYGLTHLREKFLSRGQFVSLDASWTFVEHWRVYGMFQYSWSHTDTTIGTGMMKFKDKSKTQGPNYAIAIERDINESFSISLGAAYNSSLSHEKHGLRGSGVKLGGVYWF